MSATTDRTLGTVAQSDRIITNLAERDLYGKGLPPKEPPPKKG